ncbi:hypothetical protein HC931_23415 [Candidatus Gracilibacteria bacterium]|nr:hypothetical protein [Candidatus Gracilibacteria bacterium]NJM89680.1 hypothetical protein [Hydrococcus sp. RU_2_2]NJP21323.1 hypothetical protein [Hydrococcus sp. CRU_1_1]NJQ97613.1 hypothetical protein [Hydrococcus sp. CSU_1_8]
MKANLIEQPIVADIHDCAIAVIRQSAIHLGNAPVNLSVIQAIVLNPLRQKLNFYDSA